MTFWHNRWQTVQIGWHRDAYNDLLTKHWDRIGSNKGDESSFHYVESRSICSGLQAKDIAVGLEMVEEAIQAFFEENKLDVVRETIHEQIHHTSEPFRIIEGDIFNLTAGLTQADAWYDRAPMIAIPPTMRAMLNKFDAVGLLITFAYPKGEMEGDNDQGIVLQRF